MSDDLHDVAGALAAAARTIDRQDARILLRHVTDLSATALATYPERRLTAEESARFRALIARRAAGEPIAYLVGQREFFGHEFLVTPDVLIPRPETELLVELGLACVAGITAPRILDLGCGSGCIAISLALARPDAEVCAVDRSVAALEVAHHNAAMLKANVRFVVSDWCSELDDACSRFHLIVSNPPYIAEHDLHLVQGDLRFEPRGALASGERGLDAIARIVRDARHHLLPDGGLMIEHGYDQAAALAGLLHEGGYDRIEQHRDLAGIVRVSAGRATGKPG